MAGLSGLRPIGPSRQHRNVHGGQGPALHGLGQSRHGAVHVRHFNGRGALAQALPPTGVALGLVRLHARQDQSGFGARDGHVQGVELFDGARSLFLLHQRLGAFGWRLFARQKHEARRRGVFAGPVHQHRHGGGFAGQSIGVEQEHGIGFQALGTVDGQQTDRAGRVAGRGLVAFGLERAHQSVHAQKAATVLRQGLRQDVAQTALGGGAQTRGDGLGVALQDLQVFKDGRQRIVRRPLQHPALVSNQAFGDLRTAPKHSLGLQEFPPGAVRRAPLLLGQTRQLSIGPSKQGRLQSLGQAGVVVRRDQHIEQSHHVLHRRCVLQFALLGLFAGQAHVAQSLVHQPQTFALARQNHDAVGAELTRVDALAQPTSSLARFLGFDGVFQRSERGAQAVAPLGWGLASHRLGASIDHGQAQHRTLNGALGGVHSKMCTVLTRLHGLRHGGVEQGHHGRGTAAGVVAAQHIPTQALHDKVLCGQEHLGLGTAEAVNRLLGVAHQKHARCFTRTRPHIGR